MKLKPGAGPIALVVAFFLLLRFAGALAGTASARRTTFLAVRGATVAQQRGAKTGRYPVGPPLGSWRNYADIGERRKLPRFRRALVPRWATSFRLRHRSSSPSCADRNNSADR